MEPTVEPIVEPTVEHTEEPIVAPVDTYTPPSAPPQIIEYIKEEVPYDYEGWNYASVVIVLLVTVAINSIIYSIVIQNPITQRHVISVPKFNRIGPWFANRLKFLKIAETTESC